ncbi:YHS domain-containing (seleno)protein [Gilvibacter sediminis]|uniref:YHS domain-containing (seleno)protein n=1 Tax=Gilvibacter sediminis TaxID=379071 RepID=UPI00234FC3A1|nr:YHS domain-containing (seleno)protein [Gilvibacter sediminis]MDC7998054.1 YHS domain-containing (seleno)protein [Gilvibacter sediminis]
MYKQIVFALLMLMSSSSIIAQDINAKKGVAVHGYDVVAYFDGAAQEGSKAHQVEHEGTTYRFASATNAKRFKDAPEAFLPEYGGYCAYAIAKNGKKVDVNPETFEIRDGKLYLFYNSWGNNTLKKWLKEPEVLQKLADSNWNPQH